MNLKNLALATGFASMCLAGPALAVPTSIASIISSYGFFQLEDDNGEQQGADINGNGLLDVGDTLTGIIEITKINQLVAPFNSATLDGTINSHLSAVFTTEVKNKTDNGDGTFDYDFGAVGGLTGTIISFYEDDTDDLNILGCANDAACKAAVTNGTLVLDLGFTGDVDEFWFADDVNGEDLDVFDTLGNSSLVGIANYGLSVSGTNLLGTFSSSQNTCGVEPGEGLPTCISGVPNDGDNRVQWLGSANLLGGASSIPYTVTSDADIQAQVAAIPEPATLGLLGVGLLGMGFGARRRKTA